MFDRPTPVDDHEACFVSTADALEARGVPTGLTVEYRYRLSGAMFPEGDPFQPATCVHTDGREAWVLAVGAGDYRVQARLARGDMKGPILTFDVTVTGALTARRACDITAAVVVWVSVACVTLRPSRRGVDLQALRRLVSTQWFGVVLVVMGAMYAQSCPHRMHTCVGTDSVHPAPPFFMPDTRDSSSYTSTALVLVSCLADCAATGNSWPSVGLPSALWASTLHRLCTDR
jgi:hypothetical protein